MKPSELPADHSEPLGFADDHGPGLFRAYMIVAAALAIFTAASFVVNGMVHAGSLTHVTGFWIILSVAVIKALLVALYFMHLLADWSKVCFLIVPVLILAALTILAFVPDHVFDWQGI